jgi:hypothetical protein
MININTTVVCFYVISFNKYDQYECTIKFSAYFHG